MIEHKILVIIIYNFFKEDIGTLSIGSFKLPLSFGYQKKHLNILVTVAATAGGWTPPLRLLSLPSAAPLSPSCCSLLSLKSQSWSELL